MSSICKTPVEGPIALGPEGLAGDTIVEGRHHGGPFKALCSYASEYYLDWNARFGTDMPPGSFGENLFLEGLLDEDVCVGDVYACGAFRLTVTCPRGPCSTLAAHWGVKDFHLAVKEARRTGLYWSVAGTGTIEAGATLERVERPLPHWPIPAFWDAFDAAGMTREQAEELDAFPALDPDFKRRLGRWLR